MTRLRYILFGSVIVLGAVLGFVRFTHATTNISAVTSEHWAWNDTIGWIDFYTNSTITVTSAKLTGYASSSIGDISFDCGSTRNGDICAQSNYKVTNDGAGNLSGWAWSDAYGWISFDCNNHSGCGTTNYRAYIDATGKFNNWAWNDILGWITFNCTDTGLCGTSNYKVLTSWQSTSTSGYIDSTTFDTAVTTGVKLNSIFWNGLQPSGTFVRFQFAMSNSSSGPWTYVGSDGTASTYYTVDPGVATKLDTLQHNALRYVRYRVTLVSNQNQTLSPRVDDIALSFSP
jgi:hypothetical protein